MSSRAQGTIEYLILVAIIIVIALSATVLVLTFNENNTGIVLDNSNRIGGLTSGPISVVESAVDSQGNGVFYLKNKGKEGLALLSVTPENNPNQNLDSTLVQNEDGTYKVYVSDLNNICKCDIPGKPMNCRLLIKLQKDTTIKTAVLTTTTICADVVPKKPVVDPVADLNTPIVYLLSPLNEATQLSHTVNFDFNVTDDSNISRCELFINGFSDTNITSVPNGENTISKTFNSDALIDWNVACVDTSNNIGASVEKFSLNIDSNNYQITTCAELQEMGSDLSGSYELIADLNCSSTRFWNLDHCVTNGFDSQCFYFGFTPIGTCGSGYECDVDAVVFTGNFNGNNHTISDIFIDRPFEYGVGLFGAVGTGTSIRNLSLENFSVSGYTNVGLLAGSFLGDINNVHVTGAVTGTDQYTGGIIGKGYVLEDVVNYPQISFSSANVIATGSLSVGGIAGIGANISKSSSQGTVHANSGAGGLVGHILYKTVTESFSSANVSAVGSRCGGLIGSAVGSTISKSYATGTTTGGSLTGALIGSTLNETTVSETYATGLVTSTSSYSSGLVGKNDTMNEHVWPGYPQILLGHFDTETTGKATGCTFGCSGRDVTANTTSEMKNQSTFTDWDFTNTWDMCGSDLNYPNLKWQNIDCILPG